jgi:hypothetical protein
VEPSRSCGSHAKSNAAPKMVLKAETAEIVSLAIRSEFGQE